MWKKGIITVNGKSYRYCAKVYDEGSEFGINEGRISKLTIIDANDETWSRPVINYDRGWDIEADNAEDCEVLRAVLGLFK